MSGWRTNKRGNHYLPPSKGGIDLETFYRLKEQKWSKPAKAMGNKEENAIDINNVNEIKANALARPREILWIKNGSKIGLILPNKYGYQWWAKAKKDDLLRVIVY